MTKKMERAGPGSHGGRVISPEALARIWSPTGYRVFISHNAAAKKDALRLKTGLEAFGVSGFVAHVDIEPNQEWQNEIENALDSMDAFVALLTSEFHDSLWTDQEVGFALARRVPIIALKRGLDPYGFIGKLQALACDADDAAKKVTELLMSQSAMVDAYAEAVADCGSFNRGNTLSEMLPFIEKLTKAQAARLVEAYNGNSEVKGSFGFNGRKPYTFGHGLLSFLQLRTGREYQENEDGAIELV